MIQITDKTQAIDVLFPRSSSVNYDGDYGIVIVSELTHGRYQWSSANSSSGSTYYKFSINFSEVVDGEYNYEILSPGKNSVSLGKGLIRVGEINSDSTTSYGGVQPPSTEYNTTEHRIIFYEP